MKTREEIKKQLTEATEEDLLFNILISLGRFEGDDDMPDEEFVIHQGRDIGCRDELERRGLTDEEIEQKVEQLREKIITAVRSGKMKLPEALWFLKV